MAKTYIATRKVKIGNTVFQDGETIKGVSAARCEHLNGRFIKAVPESKTKSSEPPAGK